MFEVGIFYNGASDLPIVYAPNDGVVIVDGNTSAVHASFQRNVVAHVRQGILADRLGYNYWFSTEHHFQPEGAEFNPNPLLTEAAIAARTKQIRLGQQANIIAWWHPVRLAEQAAMVDVISGGRLEFGIGRGYQPREAEVFGWPYGSTVQDQERNRSYVEEAFQIILKCWTEPSFSHHGEFFSIPPSYTKWHHKQTMAVFSRPDAERKVEDVLKIGPPDMYSSGSPIMAATTTLRELSVFPQPLQKPYPQIWEPVTSERSVRWAARHGLNCFTVPDAQSRLKRNVEAYYEESEKAGWPDRLNRGRWKFGWDSEKRRGYVPCRYVHILKPGPDEKERMERYRRALELQWDYFGPFAFQAVLTEVDEPPMSLDARVTADLLIEKNLAFVGTPELIIEKIVRLKEYVGYEDFLFTAWFEGGGYSTEEIEEQMYMFAEEVIPHVAKECGGKLDNPPVDTPLVPEQRQKV